METLLLLGGLVFIVVFSLVLIMVLANAQWHFTRVEKGNTAFVVKGDDLKFILPNVDGHKISEEKDLEGRRWLIKVNVTKDAKKQKEEMREAFEKHLQLGTRWLQWLLWDKLGIRFVSWFWPQIRVHKMHISMNRLREARKNEDDTGEHRLRDKIEPDEGDVDSLRFLVPRPVLVEGVELAGDNARLNILVLAMFRVVIPSLPVFYLKGKFMPLFDADVSSAVIDFCATHKVPTNDKGEYDPEGTSESTLTQAHWLRLSKGKGSPIQIHLQRCNASPEFYEGLKKPGKEEFLAHLDMLLGGKPEPLPSALKDRVSSGFIPKFGFFLESAEVIDWEPTEETATLSAALRAKQIAIHTAEGVREEAYGLRDAIMAKGSADADRIGGMIDRVVKSLRAQGVPADQIAGVVTSVFQAEQLKQIPNLQTLILGESKATAMVPTTTPMPVPISTA